MSLLLPVSRSLRALLLMSVACLPVARVMAGSSDWTSYTEVYKKGKITVVTFFSPTSEPSMALLRQMDGLKLGKPAELDFDVIGVLVDPKPNPGKAAKEAVSSISMPICHDQGHMVSSFGYSSGSIGMVVILDKDGGKAYASHSSNATVAKDVLAKLTELSRGPAKPVITSKPADAPADCSAVSMIVRAAETGDFSSLKGLSLPGAQGVGKVITGGYTVYLTTGMRAPNTEYIKGKMARWRDQLLACLPDFTANQTMESVLLAVRDEHFTLPELWLSNSKIELRIIQQEALDRTNIMLMVKKL